MNAALRTSSKGRMLREDVSAAADHTAQCKHIKTLHMGTDDGEYVASETAKWTLSLLRSNKVSLRWEGQVNNAVI